MRAHFCPGHSGREPTSHRTSAHHAPEYLGPEYLEKRHLEDEYVDEAAWCDEPYDETDALMYEGYDGLEKDATIEGNTVRYTGPFLECLQGDASNVVRSGAPRTNYYHSGVNRGLFLSWIEEENARGMQAGAMVNARSAAQPALLRAYQDHDVPVVMDSGAFQRDMTLGRYLRTIERIEREGMLRAGMSTSGTPGRGEVRNGRSVYNRLDWLAVLDEVGGTDLGETNYEKMRQQYGIAPLYVHQVAGGDNLAFVDTMLGRSEMIGVGGLVPIIRRDVSAACRVIEEVGAALDRNRCKAHFFGVGARFILTEFAGESWFASADSQKWLAGQKARKLYRSDGTSLMVQNAGLALSQETCARQNLRQISTWAGCPGDDFEDQFSDHPLQSTTGAERGARALGLLLTDVEVEANNVRVRETGRTQFGLFDAPRSSKIDVTTALAASNVEV